MSVVFGTLENESRLKVVSIAYLQESHPEGYSVPRESIPEYPAPLYGKDYVMYFNPQTLEFSFEVVNRELSEQEELSKLKQLVGDLAELLLEGGS